MIRQTKDDNTKTIGVFRMCAKKKNQLDLRETETIQYGKTHDR